MEKKLERLLRPGKGVYFIILFGFCGLSFLTGRTWLGVGELVVALLTLTFYLVERQYRKRALQQFLQSASIPRLMRFVWPASGPDGADG